MSRTEFKALKPRQVPNLHKLRGPDRMAYLQVAGNKDAVDGLVSWLRAWQPGFGAAQAPEVAENGVAGRSADSDSEDEWLRVSVLTCYLPFG